MEFISEKVCKDCGNTDVFTLTKIEAAFSLKDSTIQKAACTNCSSVKWSSYWHNKPGLDIELLNIWGYDPDLYFMDQDEDIILAEEENVPLFLNAIDKQNYPQKKLNTLLAALCIIVYDNVIADKEYTEQENIRRRKTADKVITELIPRKHLVAETKDWEIMDYVRQIVFPLIGLNERK
tara:strand:+ start:77 stop:613 length:537 start_codon:yes stop_codon:yes gene_type:complete